MADDAALEETGVSVEDALGGDGVSGDAVDVGADGGRHRDGGEDVHAGPGPAPGSEPSSTGPPADGSGTGAGSREGPGAADDGGRQGSDGAPPEAGFGAGRTGGEGEEEVLDLRDALAAVKESVGEQARDTREVESERTREAARAQVRRLVGVDRNVEFAAESVQHVMGLTRDGEPVNLELEKELLGELKAAGIDLEEVKLRYETLSQEDRREFTTFEVQQTFLRALDRVEQVADQVSVRLGHRIRMFEGQGKDHLKLVAALRLVVGTEQKKVKELVSGVRERLEAEKAALEALLERVGSEREQLRELLEENPRNIAKDAKKKLDEQVQGLQQGFDEVGGYLKSCENRAREITERLGSAGAAATAVEQEASRVVSELQRVAGSGFAVRRLALLGGVIGSAVGGFFAFVVLLLLWAVTSG